MKLDTLKLKCGVTLHLKPVNPDAIYNLYREMGFYDAMTTTPNLLEAPREWAVLWESALDDAAKLNAFEKTEQLFNYCCGWGVVDDPPAEAVEELRVIGLPTEPKRVARINWVRFLLMEDGEPEELIGQVMALSEMRRMKRALPEVRDDKARIAELEAQVEKLRAQGDGR